MSAFYLSVSGNANLELLDSESGPDLTLSPQTFTSTAEAFINDNSDSLGVPGDNDTGEYLLISNINANETIVPPISPAKPCLTRETSPRINDRVTNESNFRRALMGRSQER